MIKKPKLDLNKFRERFGIDIHQPGGEDDTIGIVAVPVKSIPDEKMLSSGAQKSEKGCKLCGAICWVDKRSQEILKEFPDNVEIYCAYCFLRPFGPIGSTIGRA
jgi:hypothetical protein